MARMKANEITIPNRTPTSVPVTAFSEVQGNMVCFIMNFYIHITKVQFFIIDSYNTSKWSYHDGSYSVTLNNVKREINALKQ